MWKCTASVGTLHVGETYVGTLHVGEISVGVCNGWNGSYSKQWKSAMLITHFMVRLLFFNMWWKRLKPNLFEKFPRLRLYNNFVSKSSHIFNTHIARCICFPPNSTFHLRSTKSSPHNTFFVHFICIHTRILEQFPIGSVWCQNTVTA